MQLKDWFKPADRVLLATHKHVLPFKKVRDELCARHDSPPEITPPMRHIVAVGADYRTERGFGARDRLWLAHALSFCDTHKVPLAPDFTIHPVNLATGEDFLDPKIKFKADILLSCFIVDPEKFSFDKSVRPSRYENGYLQSPWHSREAWAEAARKAEARLIITFNRAHEIDSTYFVRPDYQAGPTQELIAPIGSIPKSYRLESVLRTDLAHQLGPR